MRTLRAALSMIVFLCAASLGLAAEPAQEPFQIVPTPTGCVVSFDGVVDEFRIDRLVDGGVNLTLFRTKLPALEKLVDGGCISRFRVSSSYDGQGSTVELRPIGHEFSAGIRSGKTLKIAFEKVVDLGGSAPSSADRSYRIGVGDQIQITVYNNEDLTRKTQVGADGNIDYPLLGSVKVAGKSVREVQESLESSLRKDYIVNPQVSVEVLGYRSQYVYVTGPVKNPGKVPLEGGTTLKDALSGAGGLLPDAGYGVSVARRSIGSDGIAREPEKYTFSRSDIETGLANLDLQPNDVVTVSERDWFYIQMEVRKPGRYEITPGLTVLQAIAVAEGLTDWADRKKVSLIRNVAGQTVRQSLDLKSIERQKAPDMPLSAGDIIIVPRRIL